MAETLLWWVLLELIGLAVFPIAFHFFRKLPDRGYSITKPLGLVLMAYPFWLLASFGFLENNQGSIALIGVAIALLSWWRLGRAGSRPRMVDERLQPAATMEPQPVPAAEIVAGTVGDNGGHSVAVKTGQAHAETGLIEQSTREPANKVGDAIPSLGTSDSPIKFLRDNLKLVITTELVFAVGFLGWAYIRAYMPDISATEKPMDFAFLNGILQSRQFPPLDPWLSGYAISYYYFGYLIIAMLTMLSGIASSIAFNLAIALVVGLGATGAFGLTYNLIAGAQESLEDKGRNGTSRPARSHALVFSLLAPVFLVLMGNLEGLFEALHARGWGSAAFWQWLDVKGLAEAPVTGTFVPTDNWWWWRASRVIHDVARGQTQEVIDEFPQFSFLLGDMHPHVLALPFAFLALAIGLKLIRETRFSIRQSWPEFLLIALVIGALPPLNFWDIVPYGFIAVVAFAASRYRVENHWDALATREVAIFASALGIAAVALYIPFYAGFQSQAGGLLPVLFVKTRLHQYLIMFGFFILVFVILLVRLAYEHRTVAMTKWVARGAPALAALVALPVFVAILALALVSVVPAMRDQARGAFPNAPDDWLSNLLSAFFGPLISDPWLFVLLVLLLTLTIALFRLRLVDLTLFDTSTNFVLLIMFTGLLLTFGVEFVYLRDVFGTRMNSVFKFYYQVWALFSVAAAFAVYYVSRQLRGVSRGAWLGIIGALLLAGLVYPVLAIPDRAEGFNRPPTLDGIDWIKSFNPADYAAIQWLQRNAPRGSTILEAPGGEYSYGNRISMATGLPTVLGWFGHEDQWRGNTKLFKNDAAGIDRPADIERIYQTLDAAEALTLMGKYDISFVVVGDSERTKYGLTAPQVDKFGKVMSLVFQDGNLRIYARPSASN